MSIKKMYTTIVEVLEANQDKLVSDIMGEIIELCTSKQNRSGGNTFIKNVDGEVVAINCYYFKKWMPLVGEKAVEFGAKKSTATGFNTMCREGVSHWTRQNRTAAKANAALLDRLEHGEVTPDSISIEKANIAEAKAKIVETDLGFATREEIVEYLKQNGESIDN